MKKLLLALLVLLSMNLLSQTNDTIILKTGEIIPCQIDNISKSGVVTYYHLDKNGLSAMSMTGNTLIKKIKSTNGIIIPPKMKYPTRISLYNEPYKIQGALYEIKDSSLLFAEPALEYGSSAHRYEIVNLNINDIEKIKVKENSPVLIGLGCVIGGIAGVVAFRASVNAVNYHTYELAFVSFCASTIVGGTIGGWVGSSIKIKIPINGSMNNYNTNKWKLKKYSQK